MIFKNHFIPYCMFGRIKIRGMASHGKETFMILCVWKLFIANEWSSFQETTRPLPTIKNTKFVDPPILGVKEGRSQHSGRISLQFWFIYHFALNKILLVIGLYQIKRIKLENQIWLPFHSIHIYYNSQTRLLKLSTLFLSNSQIRV